MNESKRTANYVRKSAMSAFAVFGLAIAFSVGYAAWNNSMVSVTSGTEISSTAWNAVIENVTTLKSKLTSVSCPAGKFVSGFDASGNIVCTNIFNTIVANGAGRKWSNDTFASSCYGYRYPSGINSYSGNVGDGIYTIKPGTTEFNVYCDMTSEGGGWTLVARAVSTIAASTQQVSGAVATVLDPSQTFVGKLSDATINQIAPYVSGSAPVFKQDCQGRVNYYKLNAGFDATAGLLGTIQVSNSSATAGYNSVNNSYGSCSKGLQACDCSSSSCWGHNAGRGPGALYGAVSGFGANTTGCYYTDTPTQLTAWSNGNGKTWVR